MQIGVDGLQFRETQLGSRELIQMDNIHGQKSSGSNKESDLNEMVIIKNSTNKKCWKREPCTLLLRT